MREVLAVLFPYLVLLYLFDCVAGVRSGHSIFVSGFGRRFRLKGDGAHPVSLLPTGRAVLSHDLPLFLSAGGVYLPAVDSRWDRPLRAPDLRFLPWSGIASASSEGRDLLVNGTLAVTLPSPAAAAGTAAAIRDLAASPPARRRAKTEARLAETFDLPGLDALRERLRSPLLGVSILSSLLFLSVYAVLPLALFARSLQGRSLVPLLLGMALAYVLALAAAFAAHKAIDPDDASGRSHLLLLLVLLPPGAAHVLGPLTRDLFARYDRLTVAAALLPPRDFTRLARKEAARIAFSELPSGADDLAEFLRMRERALRRLLEQAGVDAGRLLEPPRKESPEAERYCPACEVEYMGGADRCADCDIPLADFGGNQESACAKSSPG